MNGIDVSASHDGSLRYFVDFDDRFKSLEVGQTIRAIGFEMLTKDSIGFGNSQLISHPAAKGKGEVPKSR